LFANTEPLNMDLFMKMVDSSLGLHHVQLKSWLGVLFLFLFHDLAVPVLYEPPDPRPHGAADAEQLQFLVVHVA
jgi:hypothetical protein